MSTTSVFDDETIFSNKHVCTTFYHDKQYSALFYLFTINISKQMYIRG